MHVLGYLVLNMHFYNNCAPSSIRCITGLASDSKTENSHECSAVNTPLAAGTLQLNHTRTMYEAVIAPSPALMHGF